MSDVSHSSSSEVHTEGDSHTQDTHDQEHSVPRSLSPLASSLIEALEDKETVRSEGKIKVNPLISRVATWYEKFRNAMDYREEEVVLRAAIERILKRRILFGGNRKTIAGSLIRELAWARYFKEDSLLESSIDKVATQIDLFLNLRENLLSQKVLPERVINEWIYHLLSSDIEQMLNIQKETETVAAFMFRILKDSISIADMDEQTKDVQVFIAIRRAFAKDDIAFLRYHLFSQFYEKLTSQNSEKISASFFTVYSEIQKQLHHPKKEAIFGYVKSKTAVFLILEDILRFSKGKIREVVTNEKELERIVMEACQSRYSSITSKVRRAIIRSVIFLLLTKAFFAFFIEGTFENYFYGHVLWSSIIINVTIPPLLMILVGLFIRAPRQANSKLILEYIKKVLFEENSKLGEPFIIKKTEKNKNMDTVFTLLWFFAFLVTFGGIVFVLNKIHFNIISQSVFIFFLAIVSFLSYRIRLLSQVYTVEERQSWNTPIVDFFFMPIIRVGRHLTDGIAQINILIFVFDFIIETPFKGIFAFFEQLFLFLHAKREGLD